MVGRGQGVGGKLPAVGGGDQARDALGAPGGVGADLGEEGLGIGEGGAEARDLALGPRHVRDHPPGVAAAGRASARRASAR